MNFNFGHAVLNLPASVLSLTDATAVQLRVLLWLASDLTLADKPRQLAKKASCSQKEATDALLFWASCGVLIRDGAIPTMATPADLSTFPGEIPQHKLLHRANELPIYSSEELTALLEKRISVRALVDEAQQILGKIFNPSELNILVGMLDYLGMKEESIILLLAHSAKIGKTNLRSIEKYAYQLVDRGITEPDALEEEFRTVEAMQGFEGEVRRLFGMKSRALTTQESKMLRSWIQFGYGIDVVTHAYELTVNATGEASVPYANSILERWNADGLHTIEEIKCHDEAKRQKKTAKKGGKTSSSSDLGNSFDTDDFFEAALRRSFAVPEGND